MTTTSDSIDLGDIKLDVVGRRDSRGSITVKQQVYVSLIPTIAQSVIVKYDPEIQVSCVIPPREYEIAFSANKHAYTTQKKAKVKSPTLIMSCGYGDVPTPESYKRVAHGYGLFVYDTTRQNQIWAKPYMLANVWEQGKICFGSLVPGSLRQAFNYYWTSGFNTDLMRTTHICKKKLHAYYGHVGCRCERKIKHSCACSKDIFHNHFGCGCVSVASSKACKGNCGNEKPGTNNKSCYCCKAINSVLKKALKKDPQLTSRKLAQLTKQAIDDSYPGCGCSFRHKRTCLCNVDRYTLETKCNCPCECACCLKKCNHKACNCSCCKNICGCRCNCSQVEKLAMHLENYHETLVNNKWSDYTGIFCGTKYWASTKNADGVLVCNNKNLLSRIPREFWRKDKNGQPLIICLATKADKTWKFESGGYTFKLHEDYVITK